MKTRQDLIKEAADESFEKGLNAYRYGYYIDAETELSNVIRLNPSIGKSNTKPFYYRGLTFLVQRQYEDAIKDFRNALQSTSSDNKIYPHIVNKLTQSYYEYGIRCINQNKIDHAIAQLNMAMEYNNLCHHLPAENIYFNLGNAYFRKNEYQASIHFLTLSINTKPLPQTYNNRGNCHKKIGDYDAAIADYTEAIRLNPNRKLYYHQRAMAYYANNNLANAVRNETKAIFTIEQSNEDLYDKETILNHIKTLPTNLKIILLKNCLDPVTSLGHFFFEQRGLTAPSYTSGTLKEIIDLLKAEDEDTDALIFSIQEKNYRPVNAQARFFPPRQPVQPDMNDVCDERLYTL